MNRILFVDDVRNVLDGISRSLWLHRKTWDMRFAESGLTALAECESQPFDIVVSDMHMPGMDGGELLIRVQQCWPTTMRVILSGYAARDAILESTSTTHRFLSKPCRLESILEIMAGASSLSRPIEDEALRRACSGIGYLPRSAASARDIAGILSGGGSERMREFALGDAGVALKALQLVNCGFLSNPVRICGISEAIERVGSEVLRFLLATSQQYVATPEFNAELEGIERRTRLVSGQCAVLAEQADVDPATRDLFVASGVLHSVGAIVARNEMYASGPTISPAFRPESAADYCGVNEELNASAAVYLLKLWGLPDEIGQVIECAARHDLPLGGGDKFTPSLALCCAIARSREETLSD